MDLSEDDKRLSKIYRKIVTSNEYKAGKILEKLDSETKDKVFHLIRKNKADYEHQLNKQQLHQ
ncbi:hypothetical protein GLW07_20895 [Bacillus hwajinpoensis]|uniref:Uncharacterized protein n=1 Tax=Guptibacillus hwajinpoensis TaxID=208199 RepID=A0A845F5C0_9BACL|nr:MULTISPECIES: hypothetical protein [Bacillaceae]MCA0992995.1 hypothetical protein [Pseudalkalibacillus hwajinpoensis]MYL65825.1 hypothetical protein [Pseudalkalibacillus hwajinpoensis]PFG03060.1 hypothetical protein ATG70_4289 [Bacillus sp. es.036]QHA90452.1 hypothetical protein GNK04_02875 [Bacillus sp. N1-1]